MFGLTERQRKLYDFLLACEQRKYTPSYREMAEHMGLKNHGNIAVCSAWVPPPTCKLALGLGMFSSSKKVSLRFLS